MQSAAVASSGGAVSKDATLHAYVPDVFPQNYYRYVDDDFLIVHVVGGKNTNDKGAAPGNTRHAGLHIAYLPTYPRYVLSTGVLR